MMRDKDEVLLGDRLRLSIAQIAFHNMAQNSLDTGGTK
jgi:hypothetical protein